MATPTNVIRIKDLKVGCDSLEKVVIRLGVATSEELAPHKPGGQENEDTGVWGWKRWNDVLHRYHAKVQFNHDISSTDTGDEILLQALKAEPLLITKPAINTEDDVRVYPKSFVALMECQKRDHLIGWLAVRYHYYQDQNGSDDLLLIQRVLDELMTQYAALAWIVTAPGPGLPWWEYDTTTGELTTDTWSGDLSDIPVHIRSLDIIQYLLIIRAYAQVNSERLHILRSMLSHEGLGKNRQRPTWSLFFANASAALQAPAITLMRDRSLGEILATLQLRSVADQDAREDAKGAVA